MELSDLHNPTCKLHASQSFEDHSPVRERRHSDTVSDIFLSPEAYKATQAVEFIAEHLRNEDEYVQVNIIGNLWYGFLLSGREDGKFSCLHQTMLAKMWVPCQLLILFYVLHFPYQSRILSFNTPWKFWTFYTENSPSPFLACKILFVEYLIFSLRKYAEICFKEWFYKQT